MATNNSANTYFVPTIANEVTQPSQPCFAAHNDGALLNVTGDGTTYTVIFGIVDFDQNSDYNNGTGIFTVPIDGKYLFSTNIVMSDIAGGHTSGIISIVTDGGIAEILRMNTAALATGGIFATAGAFIIDLTATQTAKVNLTVSGAALAVDIPAASLSYFSGTLLV